MRSVSSILCILVACGLFTSCSAYHKTTVSARLCDNALCLKQGLPTEATQFGNCLLQDDQQGDMTWNEVVCAPSPDEAPAFEGEAFSAVVQRVHGGPVDSGTKLVCVSSGGGLVLECWPYDEINKTVPREPNSSVIYTEILEPGKLHRQGVSTAVNEVFGCTLFPSGTGTSFVSCRAEEGDVIVFQAEVLKFGQNWTETEEEMSVDCWVVLPGYMMRCHAQEETNPP